MPLSKVVSESMATYGFVNGVFSERWKVLFSYQLIIPWFYDTFTY